MSNEDYEDFFSGAGGGAPSFKFGSIGDAVAGTITNLRKVQRTRFGTGEPLYYDEAKTEPQWQIEATLQTDLRNWQGVTNVPTYPKGHEKEGQPKPVTDDAGLRRIYIWFKMRDAVGAALREAGAKSPAVGDWIGVRFSGEEPSGKGNPTKLYQAKYKVVQSVGWDDEPQAPAAPQTPAPPAQPEPQVPTASAADTSTQDPWATPATPSTPSGGNVPPF